MSNEVYKKALGTSVWYLRRIAAKGDQDAVEALVALTAIHPPIAGWQIRNLTDLDNEEDDQST